MLTASDVLFVARDFHSCAKTRDIVWNHQKYLELCPAAWSLEFVAMGLLQSLPKTKRGYQLVLFITDQLSKIFCSVPLWTTTATVVAKTVLEYWVFAYGAPAYALTDSGRQFVAEFFDAVCAMLEAKHYVTTAFRPRLMSRPSGLIGLSFNASAITSRRTREIGISIFSPSRMLTTSESTLQRKRLSSTLSSKGTRPAW